MTDGIGDSKKSQSESYLKNSLPEAEFWLRNLIETYVQTKEEWAEAKSLTINELFEAPEKSDGETIRGVMESVQESVRIESDKREMTGIKQPAMADIVRERLGSTNVGDFIMQKHLGDLQSSLFWNPELPEGEDVTDGIAIQLCKDQSFRLRVRKYRVSGYLNAKLDYFEAELYSGSRIIGFANAAYAPWGDEIDEHERPFCPEVADIFRKGRTLNEETFLTVKGMKSPKNREANGGELIIGRIELAHDFRGFGWEGMLCDLASLKIIDHCILHGNAPRTCTLIGDLSKYHFVPNEKMPKPLQLNPGGGLSYSEAAENAAIRRLWDGLTRRSTDHEWPWPIQVNTKGLRASITPMESNGRNQTDAESLH